MMEEMRRQDREISEAEAYELLKNAEYGFLSTSDASGNPYGIPISFVLIENKIYFHCACVGKKIVNLNQNSCVSFCVVGKTQPVYDKNFTTYFESVVLSGTAEKVTEKEEKYVILTALCEKYLPDYMNQAQSSIEKSESATCVYRIEIENIKGKAKRK